MPILTALIITWTNREYRKMYREVISGLLAGGIEPVDAPALARVTTGNAMVEQAAGLKLRTLNGGNGQ